MASDRPNIVLILTDQHRGDALGIEGHPVLQTPNLDWIAATGARFSRAYAECPSCVPARRTMMSGTAPAANGAVGMGPDPDWAPPHLLAGELTAAGYQTEMIGKSHVRGRGSSRWRYGFEHVQIADSSNTGDYAEWLADRGVRDQHAGYAHGVASNAWVGRPHHLPEELLHTFWVVDRAIHFLEHRDDAQPFFLNLSFIDPHPPFTPPRHYYDRYIDRDLPVPPVGDWALDMPGEPVPRKGVNPNAWYIDLDEHDRRCSQAAYYGMINFIDDQIGRLLQVMKTELADTVFLFTADHGEMLGDHHMFRKCWPYEGSARVPFLVSGPQRDPLCSGVVSEAAVGLQDLMPTILDIAGTPVPDSVTGRSLLPVMRGEAQTVREYLHGEHAGQYAYDLGQHYLTDGHRKYIWYSQTGREQLFDLDEDPAELHNLAPAGGAELGRWRARLVEVLRDRPEGFVRGGELVTGRPHDLFIPGYDPTKLYPYL